MIVYKQVRAFLTFHLGERAYGNSNPKLKVYPTVILQLTTLGLLMSLSTSAVGILPAYTTQMEMPELEKALQTKPEEVRSADYMPITDSKNVEKFLEDYFADMPIMAKIAKCESRNRHFDSRGRVLKGEITPLDRGVMQINLYYHEAAAEKLGLDVHNIDDNVAYARYLYEKQGAKPWMSSSACWSKFSSKEVARK